MIVIGKEKMWGYNYASPCYTTPTQKIMYMNVFHPMEHDLTNVDDRTRQVMREQELDEDYNCCNVALKILDFLGDHKNARENVKGKRKKLGSVLSAVRSATTRIHAVILTLTSMLITLMILCL